MTAYLDASICIPIVVVMIVLSFSHVGEQITALSRIPTLPGQAAYSNSTSPDPISEPERSSGGRCNVCLFAIFSFPKSVVLKLCVPNCLRSFIKIPMPEPYPRPKKSEFHRQSYSGSVRGSNMWSGLRILPLKSSEMFYDLG